MKCLNLTCGEEMEAKEQIMPNRVLVLITCRNPECKLKDYTFTTADYSLERIAPYLEASTDA